PLAPRRSVPGAPSAPRHVSRVSALLPEYDLPMSSALASPSYVPPAPAVPGNAAPRSPAAASKSPQSSPAAIAALHPTSPARFGPGSSPSALPGRRRGGPSALTALPTEDRCLPPPPAPSVTGAAAVDTGT